MNKEKELINSIYDKLCDNAQNIQFSVLEMEEVYVDNDTLSIYITDADGENYKLTLTKGE